MKAWRDSASLILAARNVQKRNSVISESAFRYDYKLLTLQRKKTASFMAESYVFPGGTVEPSDADLKWKKLFSKFGLENDSLSSLCPKNTNRLPIFKPRRNELPREISLRITAIRETFEECGILLCKRNAKKGTLTEWAEHFVVGEMQSWQSKVHNNSMEFYRLCENLGCYPDIWALHEWSNWLSPTFLPKRFDTVFYMVCMPAQPPADFEIQEMDDLKWEDPKHLLCPSNGYSFGPPQLYELARIAKFESLDNLLDFAIARAKNGVHIHNIPVRVKLSDGLAHLLPGDSMYPDQVSLTDRQILDKTPMTMAEFRDLSPVKNRLESYSVDAMTIVVDNLNCPDGHLSPLCVDGVSIITK